MAKMTPMMKQYHEIKDKYSDEILFFRLGDFYEMFNKDAKIAARELELTLTSRNKGKNNKEIPMAGIPCKSAKGYIEQLINKGYRVAICEQVEDPSQAGKIVKREVIRVVTPGTVLDSNILEDKNNNYLAAIIKQGDNYGFSYVDISTGEYALTEFEQDLTNNTIDELSRLRPSELLIDQQIKKDQDLMDYIAVELDPIITEVETSFNYDQAYELLIDHFEVVSLEGFGCDDLTAATTAAGAVLDFLLETQKRSLSHLNQLQTYSTTDYMVLDSNTRRNLELVATMRDKKKKGSLLWVLDNTVTAMGGRTLRQWMEQPLLDVAAINARHDAVEEITEQLLIKEELKEYLDQIYDIERLMGKVVYGSANARDLIALKNSIAYLPDIKQLLGNFTAERLVESGENLDPLTDVQQLIDQAIKEDPPTTLTEGGIIKQGYDEQLDEYLTAMSEGKDWIMQLQKDERDRTGIKSLKVGHNKVHGYYIEITKANLDAVPDDYIRKQTLSNSERYITPELKDKEAMILGAEEKSQDLEYQLFIKVREKIGEETERIQKSARIIAQLDALISLADVALENDYVKPEINEQKEIEIKSGRHPVVEKMNIGEPFVPNDTELDNQDNRFSIITGPNMSGKSTYMRQVALITLLAQIGSFVPATEVKLGIVDRIFTRVGASDDLTTGQSTFMVEMNEVANILNNATQDSLIILDEVGRGTSTYDGLSIAWAVIEYINQPENIGAKTLFATHYHELTELEEKLPGVRNYNVAVKEEGDDIAFLRKIVAGGADKSYGIEVAKRAGIPDEVINRSKEILTKLESDATEERVNIDSKVDNKQDDKSKKGNGKADKSERVGEQLPLFSSDGYEILEELNSLDVVSMTPLDALNQLHKLQKKAKEKLN